MDRVGALQVLGVTAIHGFTADPWLTGTALLLGLPLLRPSNTSGRPWLIALVTLELTSSWAGALTTLGADCPWQCGWHLGCFWLMRHPIERIRRSGIHGASELIRHGC